MITEPGARERMPLTRSFPLGMADRPANSPYNDVYSKTVTPQEKMMMERTFTARRSAFSLVGLALSAALLACSLFPSSAGATPTPTAAISAAGTAREIKNGESASGRLKAGGVEIYSVKVSEGEALKLDIDVEGDPNAVKVGVADSTGKEITTQRSASGKRLTVITDPLTAGDYTVTLTTDGTDELPYVLTVATGDPAVLGASATPVGPEATPTTGSSAVVGTPGTSSAAADAGTGQTACDHPYFPMRTGATWVYKATSSEASFTTTMAVTSVTGDAESAEAEMTMTLEDLVITYHWVCTRTGGLQSFDYALSGLSSASGASSDVTGEGVFLPPADQLVVNGTWTYSSSGTMTMEAGGASMSGSATNTANNTVAGFVASVDVAGGTVNDVMTVLSEQTTQVSFGGIDTPAMATRSTLEFAKGIGLVSSASAGDAGYSNMELLSYTIP